MVDAVLASASVPGLLPPVEIDGEHYLDGGIVHSHPRQPGGRARRRRGSTCCTSGGSTARSTAALAVGGRAGRLRDRPPPPRDRRPRRAPAGHRGCTCCPRVSRPPRPATCGLRYRHASGVPERIERARGRRRATWRSPGREEAAVLVRRLVLVAGPSSRSSGRLVLLAVLPCRGGGVSVWFRAAGALRLLAIALVYLRAPGGRLAVAPVLWGASGFGRAAAPRRSGRAYYDLMRSTYVRRRLAADRAAAGHRREVLVDRWTTRCRARRTAMGRAQPPRRRGRLAARAAHADEPGHRRRRGSCSKEALRLDPLIDVSATGCPTASSTRAAATPRWRSPR